MSDETNISVTDAMQPAILLAGLTKDMSYLKEAIGEIKKTTGDLATHDESAGALFAWHYADATKHY